MTQMRPFDKFPSNYGCNPCAGCAILRAMNRTLTNRRRAVCGGGRTAQNARRTCAVCVAQSGGGQIFSRKERVRGRFFRVTRDFRRWMASVGRRAVVSRLSTAQNFTPRCAGTNFSPKISPCGVQGQIFHQKFRPAVCRDKFFTQIISLRSAGTEFWRRSTPIFVKTPKKGHQHAST